MRRTTPLRAFFPFPLPGSSMPLPPRPLDPIPSDSSGRRSQPLQEQPAPSTLRSRLSRLLFPRPGQRHAPNDKNPNDKNQNQNRNANNKRKNEIPAPKPPLRRLVPTLALAAASLLALRKLIGEHIGTLEATAGPSMYPSIRPRGNWLVVSKRFRHGAGIEVGDVVVVRHPWFRGESVAKRVVGMSGDLVLRGEPPGQEGEGDGRDMGAMMVEVPEGHIWIVGDNLPWSRDSREYGPIPLGLVMGKVLYRVNGFFKLQPIENTLQPAKFADD